MSTVPSFKTRVGVRRPALFFAAVLAACSMPDRVDAQRTVFRSTVDVIAVDVQVVDRDGNPIERIGPDDFEVSINGQRRKVQSAQFLRHRLRRSRGRHASDRPLAAQRLEEREAEGRTVHSRRGHGSFEVGSERAPMEGARSFIQRLNPSDRVGLFVYPTGAKISPTTARAVLAVSLDRVIGQKDPLRSHFNLRPWEIVDITARSTNPQLVPHASRANRTRASTRPLLALDPVLQVRPGSAHRIPIARRRSTRKAWGSRHSSSGRCRRA